MKTERVVETINVEYEVKTAPNGDTYWYKDDVLHRENGPAVILVNDLKEWYKYGELHRKDGPAVKYDNGYKEWYIDGVQYTEKEWKKKVSK